MKINKIDLMVDAVRYSEDGQINFVRGFEKRASSFSDNVLIPRDALVDLLKNGKTVVSGTRVRRLGSTFEIRSEIKLSGLFVTNRSGATRDSLENVPLL